MAAATTSRIIVVMRVSPAFFFDSQHCLYFLPLPQGQVSLRPTLIVAMGIRIPRSASYRLPRRPRPRSQSTLQIPDPRVATYRKMKQ